MKSIFATIINAAILAEGMEDSGCLKLNKVQAFALDLGATEFDFEEGVGHISIAGPEAAQQLMDFLDSEDCIEGYDLTHSGKSSEDEDILSLPEETAFAFTFYLDGDVVTYDGEEVDAVDEATFGHYVLTAAGEIAAGPFAASALSEARAKYDGSHTVSYGRVLDEMFDPLVEAIAFDENGAQLDEIAKKIQVNHKGAKRIKMQCPAGFKFSTTEKACMKIGGDELAKRRKASVRAVVSRKAGGAALQNRANIRTKKAMKFRSAMGLK